MGGSLFRYALAKAKFVGVKPALAYAVMSVHPVLSALAMVTPAAATIWLGEYSVLFCPPLFALSVGLAALWLLAVHSVCVAAFPQAANGADFALPWAAVAMPGFCLAAGYGVINAGPVAEGALIGIIAGLFGTGAACAYMILLAAVFPAFLRADLRTADLTPRLLEIARAPRQVRPEHSLMAPPIGALVLHWRLRNIAAVAAP